MLSTSGIPDKGPAKKAKAVAKQLPSTNNNKRRAAVIIGDSLVKNIKAWELKEKCDSSGNVYVKCFNGAMIKDMKCYTQPTIERKPNLIILPAGTNDLSLKLNNEHKYELHIANEIIELANSIKENGIEVVISLAFYLAETDLKQVIKELISYLRIHAQKITMHF